MDAALLQAEKEFSGPLITILKNLDDFVSTNVTRERSLMGDGFQQQILTNYPTWALRELLMNAVMHRDYESKHGQGETPCQGLFALCGSNPRSLC